jgi:dTDP-4-amino-4,6-dideoxygalactose transaminase
VERRKKAAAQLDALLEGVPGVAIPRALPGCDHTYWRYALTVDPQVINGGAQALGKWLNANGCEAGANYVGKPAYKLRVFRERATFGKSAWPFVGPHITAQSSPQATGTYRDTDFPGSLEGLDRVVVLPWNEHYTPEHVEYVAGKVRQGAEQLSAARRAEAA